MIGLRGCFLLNRSESASGKSWAGNYQAPNSIYNLFGKENSKYRKGYIMQPVQGAPACAVQLAAIRLGATAGSDAASHAVVLEGPSERQATTLIDSSEGCRICPGSTVEVVDFRPIPLQALSWLRC